MFPAQQVATEAHRGSIETCVMLLDHYVPGPCGSKVHLFILHYNPLFRATDIRRHFIPTHWRTEH